MFATTGHSKVFTDKVRQWFQEQEAVSGLEKTIKRVFQEYGVKNLKWEVGFGAVCTFFPTPQPFCEAKFTLFTLQLGK